MPTRITERTRAHHLDQHCLSHVGGRADVASVPACIPFPSIGQHKTLMAAFRRALPGERRPRPERPMLSDRTVTLIRHRQAVEEPP